MSVSGVEGDVIIESWIFAWRCPGCEKWTQNEGGWRCEHCGQQWAICPNEYCYGDGDRCPICHGQTGGLVPVRED